MSLEHNATLLTLMMWKLARLRQHIFGTHWHSPYSNGVESWHHRGNIGSEHPGALLIHTVWKLALHIGALSTLIAWTIHPGREHVLT